MPCALQLAAAFRAGRAIRRCMRSLIGSSSERAFCAGGDVREMAEWGRTRMAEARRSLAAEYALNWPLDCFIKPTVSLIDGVVMGAGVGITPLRHASGRRRALSIRHARDRHRPVSR